MPTTTSPDGTTIHYEVAGAGDRNLVLLHGLGDDGSAWEPQVAALADTCRILLPTVRGHGQSAKPANGDYDIRSMARDVLAVADAEGMAQLHVVGLSMGGGVAFEVALLAPERVQSLVIINSTPTAKVGGLLGKAAIGVRKLMARFLTPEKAAPKIAARLFPDPGQEALRDEVARRLGDNDPEAYRESLYALARFHRADEASGINVPTLFIHSEHDYTPLKWRQPFVDAMPNARLAQVDGAHHAVTAEYPAEVNALLLDHLATAANPA